MIVETTAENGWKITPEQFEEAMTPLTKMIILNSPNNPTGAVYTKEELEKLAEIAIGEDIVILSDEIYEKLVYGENKHVSIASLSKEIYDHTITVNGFSKAYAMTGWRLGYTAAPKAIANAIDTIQSHTTSNPTTFAQFGAIAALNGDQQVVADMRDEFNVRREFMLDRLLKIKNVRVVEPQGAFYFLVNIEPIGIKSVNFAEKLLSKQKVAAVPGIAFGSDYTIRFSYATEPRRHQQRHGPLRGILQSALSRPGASTPRWVATAAAQNAITPLGLKSFSNGDQDRRETPTLGCMTQPRWDRAPRLSSFHLHPSIFHPSTFCLDHLRAKYSSAMTSR